MHISRCNRIEDCIEYGKDLKMSHSKFYEKALIETKDKKLIVAPYTSILSHYRDYIEACTYTYTFTDEEFVKYCYKPKMYCYEEFGNMELWSLLLKVNNMISIMDFNKRTIKTFHEEAILEVLNEIIILEKSRIEKNEMEVEQKIYEASLDK